MMKPAILKVLVAAAVVGGVTGCGGPTKKGIEARSQANARMNIVNAQVHYDQAKQSFQSGQFDKALREIRRAIARYQELPNYHVLQGRIFLETHQLEAALESFQTSVDLCEKRVAAVEAVAAASPKVSSATAGLQPDAETLAESHYFIGIVYQRWSDDERAYRHYSIAFDNHPTNPQYLLAAAESLIAMGEFDMAQQLIEPKMNYFEHNAALRQLQGQIALLKGDPAGAAALYGEARLLAPDDLILLEQLMWAQFAAEQYGLCHESIKRLQDRIASKRTLGQPEPSPRTDLMHIEARCLNLMGRTTEARELYIQLSTLRPSDPIVWTELGTLAWELGDYRRVAMCSVQLIALAPHRYEGYMLKGLNERNRGNLGEAIRLFQQSADRATDTALPHLLLGQALEQNGNQSEAMDSYALAMEVEPDSAEARELIRRLSMQPRLSAAPTE